MDWSEWFYYDETSPTFLRWKRARMGGRCHNVVIREKGSVAGHRRKDGYCCVKFDGKNYKIHRIIFEIITGKCPNFVDHLDGNSSNNRFSNLREVTHLVNCKNRGVFKTNTSGKTGVQLYTNSCGNTYWVATWREEGKKRSKCFSTEKLGYDNAFDLACKLRDNQIEKDGNYTERHKNHD
jgi:hypothetical protein